ncbi:hypothetical protein BC363_13665 [Ensifer sp. LC384]|nr:hypothetical protein BC363_13665 [Ensifer sp. LC384]
MRAYFAGVERPEEKRPRPRVAAYLVENTMQRSDIGKDRWQVGNRLGAAADQTLRYPVRARRGSSPRRSA